MTDENRGGTHGGFSRESSRKSDEESLRRENRPDHRRSGTFDFPSPISPLQGRKIMPKKRAAKKAAKAAKKSVKTAAKRAGRPKGSGKYGCETKAVRIPTHMVDEVQSFIRKKLKGEGKTVK